MKLFERGMIGNVEIKNRLVMAPMGTMYDSGKVTDTKAPFYYEERAKGGFGLIMLGGNVLSEKYEPCEVPVLDGFLATSRLSQVVDRIHYAGAKVAVQIASGVGRNCWFIDGHAPKSASDCDWFWNPGVKCIPFTREEIKDIIDAHGKAAALAKISGADMLVITAYGGYLTDQFLTELWNHRTDEYGGCFKNRMRFLKESYEAARKAVGPDFPIIIKYTPEHKIPGGRTLDEGIAMALEMEKWGVDGLITDLGCYDRWYLAIGTVYSPEGYHAYMGRALKNAGVKIPVLASGNQKNPEVAKKTIESGDVDFILIGHQSKADAYFPAKIKAGREEDIRPCIGCNECLMAGQRGDGRFGCAVNPLCYHENDYSITAAKDKKKVLVIGGGPGGAVAALVAHKRGHNVRIWEKSDSIGGNLKTAGAPSFKTPVAKLVKYYEDQLRKEGVPLYLNKEATVEAIKKEGFDHIICATGSAPIMPQITGIDKTSVLSCEEAICGEKLTGHVVVIGGGLVGCEAAVHISQTAEKVTIIELMDDVLMTAHDSVNNIMELKYLMEQAKLDTRCGAKVVEITDDSVVYEKDNKTVTVPCSNVVVAVGYKPDSKLVEELKANFDYEMLDIVGDAIKARKIWHAVNEGFHAALNI